MEESDYGKKGVFAALIYFNGAWHVTGCASFSEGSDTNMKQGNDNLKKEKQRQENLAYIHTEILKYNENKPIAFFKNFDEWMTFWMNVFSSEPDVSKQAELNSLKEARNIVLFTSEKSGAIVFPNLAEIIKCPENNFYNKEIATNEGISILTGDYSTSLDFLEYVINNNYIPDVTPKSSQSEEQDKSMLQDNKWFIVRFFQPNLFNSDFF
jgi:hypothetical protein